VGRLTFWRASLTPRDPYVHTILVSWPVNEGAEPSTMMWNWAGFHFEHQTPGDPPPDADHGHRGHVHAHHGVASLDRMLLVTPYWFPVILTGAMPAVWVIRRGLSRRRRRHRRGASATLATKPAPVAPIAPWS
ncbi:MAG: hypothetical protein ACREIT_04340, partial [Tepidisphaeraceae bacterium]